MAAESRLCRGLAAGRAQPRTGSPGSPGPVLAGPSKGAGVRGGVSPKRRSPGRRGTWHTRVEGQEGQGGCHLDALFWWKPTCRAGTMWWRRCGTPLAPLRSRFSRLGSRVPVRSGEHRGSCRPAGLGLPRVPAGRPGCPCPGSGGRAAPLAPLAAPLAPGWTRGSSRRSCGIWRLSGCRCPLCAQCPVLRLFAGAEVHRFYCVRGCALIFA